MTDIVSDPIVDAPVTGGIQFPDDMVVTTSDAPKAPEPEPKPAEEPKGESTDGKKDDGKEQFVKSAWVNWTDEGGMKVKPGKGVTVDEHGNVTIDPEVAQRIATKRVMRVRDEERARGERLAREQRERADRLERELAAARTGRADEQENEKPWTARGAPKPVLADFDDVEQFMDARDEWRDAQTVKASEPKEQASEVPQRKDFDSDAAYQNEIEERKFAEEHGPAIGEMMREGAALYEDYDEVAGQLVLSREVLKAVLESDQSAEVLYHIGSHPESVEKLNGLGGSRLHKAIGRIEDALTTPQGDTSKDPVVSNASTATAQAPSPPPVPVTKPVRGTASPRSNPADLAASADADDYFAHLKSLGI